MNFTTKLTSRLLKIGVLLVFISTLLILQNCQSDNETVEQIETQTGDTSIISLKELPVNLSNTISEVIPFSDLKRKQEKQQIRDIQLDENKIVRLVDSLKNTSYSIRFTLSNTPDNVFYNLIVGTNKEGAIKKPYILKYIIYNLDDIVNEDGFVNYSKMDATIERYSYKKFTRLVKSSKYKNRGLNEPCDTYNHNDSSSSGGGGSSGGVGSSSGGGGRTECRTYIYSTSHGGIFAIKIYCSDGTTYVLRGEDDCMLNGGGGGSGSGINGPAYCPNGKIVNGECVPNTTVDDKIINETKNPCVTNIIKELQKKDTYKALIPDLEGKSHLSQIILDLFDKSSKYNLTIDIKQLDHINPNANGNTNGFNISLDTDLVKEATQLSIAKTLIHESLHAYIHYITRTAPTSDMYKTLMSLHKSSGNKSNLTEHQFMGQYVEALAYSLSAYDSHKQNMDYYKAMSWGGLESSNTYKRLSYSEKTKIQQIINNERFNKRGAKSVKCN